MGQRDRRKRPRAGATTKPGAAHPSPEDRVMDSLGFDRVRFMGDATGAAVEALRASRDLETVGRSVDATAGAAERALRVHLAVLPPAPPVACDRGCAHCCSLRVEATTAEIVRLAQHLRSTLAGDALAAVAARVADTAARVAALDASARAEANVPCALLEGGQCIAYEARPYACRACNSASAVDCEDSLYSDAVETVVYAPQKALYRYAATAVYRALGVLGLQNDVLELHGGLRAALAEPDACARWLAGERVFGPGP